MSTTAPSWPPADQPHDLITKHYDYVEANDRLQQAETDGLFSDQIGLVACEIGRAKPFDHKPIRAYSELTNYLTSISGAANDETTRVIIIPQRISRGSLDITLPGLKALLAHTTAFPAIESTFTAFSTTESDSYIARNVSSFLSHTQSGNQLFEFTCLLKYVEKHGRKDDLTPWSVRLLGFYEQYDATNRSETAVLVHPSNATWKRTKAAMRDSRSQVIWQDWTQLLLLVFASVLNGWEEYTTYLHDKADEVEKSASFTIPKQARIGEVTERSLKDCLAHINVLRVASQALTGNIAVYESALAESRECKRRSSSTSIGDLDLFESAVERLIRETTFLRARIEHIQERRQQTVGAIRDLISIRSAHTVEKLSGRSLTEARAVRIITVVTLLFLPPTFASNFLEMNFLHVVGRSKHGLLSVTADPNMYLYLAIALPLIFATLGIWLLWEWMSSRQAKRAGSDFDSA